jgi:hypothetical protein
MMEDYQTARQEGADEEGYFELSVLHHKTSASSGPLTVYLDEEVSDVGKATYRRKS